MAGEGENERLVLLSADGKVYVRSPDSSWRAIFVAPNMKSGVWDPSASVLLVETYSSADTYPFGIKNLLDSAQPEIVANEGLKDVVHMDRVGKEFIAWTRTEDIAIGQTTTALSSWRRTKLPSDIIDCTKFVGDENGTLLAKCATKNKEGRLFVRPAGQEEWQGSMESTSLFTHVSCSGGWFYAGYFEGSLHRSQDGLKWEDITEQVNSEAMLSITHQDIVLQNQSYEENLEKIRKEKSFAGHVVLPNQATVITYNMLPFGLILREQPNDNNDWKRVLKKPNLHFQGVATAQNHIWAVGLIRSGNTPSDQRGVVLRSRDGESWEQITLTCAEDGSCTETAKAVR